MVSKSIPYLTPYNPSRRLLLFSHHVRNCLRKNHFNHLYTAKTKTIYLRRAVLSCFNSPGPIAQRKSFACCWMHTPRSDAMLEPRLSSFLSSGMANIREHRWTYSSVDCERSFWQCSRSKKVPIHDLLSLALYACTAWSVQVACLGRRTSTRARNLWESFRVYWVYSALCLFESFHLNRHQLTLSFKVQSVVDAITEHTLLRLEECGGWGKTLVIFGFERKEHINIPRLPFKGADLKHVFRSILHPEVYASTALFTCFQLQEASDQWLGNIWI